MKTKKYYIILLILALYGCSTSKPIQSDPNIGKIEIEIKAISEKDSIVRTSNGDKIGRIDKEGYIYDLAGNKIGRRKPTDQEAIKLFGF